MVSATFALLTTGLAEEYKASEFVVQAALAQNPRSAPRILPLIIECGLRSGPNDADHTG